MLSRERCQAFAAARRGPCHSFQSAVVASTIFTAALCSQVPFAFAEIGQHFGCLPGSEMQICGLPAHGLQQSGFVLLARERGDVDFGAVRREASYDPAARDAHERIFGPHRGVERLLVTDRLGRGAASPVPR